MKAKTIVAMVAAVIAALPIGKAAASPIYTDIPDRAVQGSVTKAYYPGGHGEYWDM